jgi:hypothetical protein
LAGATARAGEQMTIYIHFIAGMPAAQRLFNVASVHDAGVNAVNTKNMFTDGVTRWENVSHVAIEPQRKESE